MPSEYRELVLGEEFMDLLREPESITAVPAVDTEALGAELEDNLRAQLALYRDYLETANRQKLAMVNRSLEEGREANAVSERLLGNLAALETERLALIGKIAATRPGLPRDAAQVKCEHLYPAFSPALAQRIKGVRAGLLKAVEDLKRAMAVNKALVENGSRIIHTTIGIMTSVVGRNQNERMSTYTRKGAVNVGKVQVRNLVNRSV
jgi:hypothetical protein